MIVTLRRCMLVLGLLAVASPAAAQWSRVTDLPVTNVFSVWANGDTIVAGADTAVYVSADAGATWKRSSRPAAAVVVIDAARIRNGRLYAGTFGQGVFVSDDLGDTWQGFNQGLVGGFLDSQLDVSDLQVRGDSLYAATEGAGVYVRGLVGATTWSHFGEVFEPNQASNVTNLAVGGSRVLADAGGNGTVFIRDPGDGEWTVSTLGNGPLLPGVSALSAAWTGTGWVVGTNVGVFRSALGQEPWTFVDVGLGTLNNTWFAARGHTLFGAFDIPNFAVIEYSPDDGATWQFLESLFHAFVYQLALSGTNLYAGRADGLWLRSTATVSVPDGGGTVRLRFALAGPQPVGDQVRFQFQLPEPGTAAIEVFDVAGRRAGERVQQSWSAGAHELSWDARSLGPGVYHARLTAGGGQQVVRLVRVR